MNTKRIEVEGGELAIRNSFGDIAIIPKNKVSDVKDMLKDECWNCIDNLVAGLPKMEDYAEDGTIVPKDDDPPVPKDDGTIVPKDDGSPVSPFPIGTGDATRNIARAKAGNKLAEEFKKSGIPTIDAPPNASIEYSSNDIRRDGVVPYNSEFMHPNLQGKIKSDLTKSDNDIIGMALPIPGIDKIGKIPGILDEVFKVAKKIKYLKPMASKLSKEVKGGALSDAELQAMREELATNGILTEQKTKDFLWKEPIHKSINPWNYDIKEKLKDLTGYLIGGKNPKYMTDKAWMDIAIRNRDIRANLLKSKYSKEVWEKMVKENNFITRIYEDLPKLSNKPEILNIKSHREALKLNRENLRASKSIPIKNRVSTWDMYLGKPQTKHPLYDISELSKKGETVYTIKKDFINLAEATRRLEIYSDELIALEKTGKNKWGGDVTKFRKENGKWIIPDQDADLFGTMGGHSWEIELMPDGNVKAIARDVWDLHPFGNKANEAIGTGLGKKSASVNVPKAIKNIEVGKALGIGKPLNVKVGFIFDPKLKKIINTFGVTGATYNALSKKTNNQQDKSKE